MCRPHLASRGLIAAVALMVALPGAVRAQTPGRLADDQLLLLQEANQIVRQVGDEIWHGWSDIDKTTLVVGPTTEFLVNPPRRTALPEGFVPTDQRFLSSVVYSRPRTFSATLRASFLLDGLPVAVIGAWRPDIESPNEWVLGLVEQWFHLLQLTHGEPDKVAALRLGEGAAAASETAFPFDDTDVGNAMVLLGQSLYQFWATGAQLPREGQRTFQARSAQAALQNLQTVLTLKFGAEAYRTFQLQTWRAGVARYTGLVIARHVARAEVTRRYRHTRGFAELAAHKSYARMWEENMTHQFWLIRTSVLDGERDRTSFSALGHGLAEMLDAIDPEWKERYFEPGVWLDDLVQDGLSGADGPARANARRQ